MCPLNLESTETSYGAKIEASGSCSGSSCRATSATATTSASAGCCSSGNKTAARGAGARVIVVLARWLHQLQRNAEVEGDEISDDNRPDHQDEEEDEHGKVQDCKANHSPLSKARLLERVNWWSDLTTT